LARRPLLGVVILDVRGQTTARQNAALANLHAGGGRAETTGTARDKTIGERCEAS